MNNMTDLLEMVDDFRDRLSAALQVHVCRPDSMEVVSCVLLDVPYQALEPPARGHDAKVVLQSKHVSYPQPPWQSK